MEKQRFRTTESLPVIGSHYINSIGGCVTYIEEIVFKDGCKAVNPFLVNGNSSGWQGWAYWGFNALPSYGGCNTNNWEEFPSEFSERESISAEGREWLRDLAHRLNTSAEVDYLVYVSE